MRFLIALAIIMMSVQAELNVLQLFLGQPADESALLELDAEDEQDYLTMLNSIDTCDPAAEDSCNVYGLVQLDDGSTAIVNLGFWDDLKKGFSNVVNKAKDGLKNIGDKAKSLFGGKLMELDAEDDYLEFLQ